MDERLADMISRKWQTVALAITLAAISGQAAAHGWKPHHHRGWRHHGHSSGVWIGLGVGALVGTGFALAVGSGSRHGYGGSVLYTAAPRYYPSNAWTAVPPATAPAQANALPEAAYGQPPVDASAQPFDVTARPASGQHTAQQSADKQECRRQAMNHSGFDPANATRWTTSVATESYARAFGTCLRERGYEVYWGDKP